MTREEFSNITKGLKSIYADPKFIADKDAFDMWYLLLGDLEYQVASMATQAYMQTEHFPPTPADIRKYAEKITAPITDDMSEIEAWGLVRKAVQNGLYESHEEFEKLPKLIQKVLGSSDTIRELAMLEPETLESVEGSHFKRNYKATLEREKEQRQIQPRLLTGINQLRSDNTPKALEVYEVDRKGIEIHEETPRGISDDIQKLLDDFKKEVSQC